MKTLGRCLCKGKLATRASILLAVDFGSCDLSHDSTPHSALTHCYLM